MPTAAELIAKRLFDAGCRYAFGIPGGEVLTMMDALKAAGIRFVLSKHENCAGFMAEGVHHATGAPGVLLATIGPGVANAVNVIANAQQDRVPLIFLTGCVDPADAQTYTHQVFDHQQLLRPISKASFQAVDGAVDVIVDKAVAIALDDPPGPVHIDVPISLAAAQQVERTPPRRTRPAPAAPAPGPELDAAQGYLAAAERPVLIAGVDALNHGAAETVAALALDFKIPLITTYKAKGMLPEDHPLSLGGAGLSPLADKQLLPLLRHSDLIVLAGYDPIEMRIGWRNPWGSDANVVEFSATPNAHYMHQSTLSFVGHIDAGLKALRAGLRSRTTWPNGEPTAVRSTLKEIFRADEAWGPAAVVDTVRRVLPRNGIASADSGAHRILLSQLWECYEARGLLQSTGLCTMGCALPLAMGYKIAAPDRPVVAFTGDGGLEMILGELATLRDLKLGLTIVVFVDESLALIELKQRNSGLVNLGVDFGGTDFPALARALGGVGVTATSRETLADEFTAALGRSTFSLIACPIGARAYDGRF